MTEIGQSSNTINTTDNINNDGVSNNNSNDSTIPFDSYNYADTISTKSVNYYHGQRHFLKLTEKRVKVLKAICGTLVGCLDDAEIDLLDAPNTEKLREFGRFDLSDSDEFIDRVLDRLSKSATREKMAQVSGVLKKLGSKNVVNSQITNHNKPFYELTRKQREQVISKWSTHTRPSLRQIYRTFTFLVCATFWSDPYGFNSLIGYPGPDPDANSSRFTSRQFPTFEFLKVDNHHSSNVSAYDGSSLDIQDRSRKYQIGKLGSATIPELVEGGEELVYDVVVVGSGGGGSVIAAQLAKEGYEVLVVEKGHHVPQSELTLKQSDAYEKLYDMGGGMLSEDSGVIIHSGSNFGGGTTIGWSAASEPQHFVREEWARKHGIFYILDNEYSDSMKAINGRLGVSTNNIVHNESNKILIEGCKKLGLQVDTIPQCTASKSHSCGWCGFGCKYGEKQSAVMTWLFDAKNSGASFIQDCYVEKVLVDQKLRKVVGVEAILIKEQYRFKIRAKRVVLACGAIHTPALLLRSGLKNKNIGKNLHIHPTAGVYGIFPDKQVKTYSGSIMTAVSNFTENVDGNHYGSKIVVGSHHPAFMFANFPWKSTFQHKQFMLDYNHISPLLVMVRDKDAGKIVIDSQGQPRVDYKISTHDSKSAVAGIIASLKILVAAGAKKVGTCQTGLEEFEIDDNENPLNDSKFQQYLDKVKKIGVSPGQTLLGSIHQMGTCCMGADPTKSVVNPTGETWEVGNLFIADSSIFPTATGVDPMITVMSFAYMIAKTISDKDSDVKKKRNSIKWPITDDVSKRKVNNRSSFRNSLSNTLNGSFAMLNRKRDSQIE